MMPREKTVRVCLRCIRRSYRHNYFQNFEDQFRIGSFVGPEQIRQLFGNCDSLFLGQPSPNNLDRYRRAVVRFRIIYSSQFPMQLIEPDTETSRNLHSA